MEDEESVVANGFLEGNTLVDLVEVYMGDLVGEAVYQKFGLQFPLLVKWIDAAQDLSVQVHPDDDLAMEREECLGKSEMWYVRRTEGHAHLICGFKDGVNQMKYLKSLKENRLESVLEQVHAHAGDVFYVPAGTVHALRAGLLVAEIQESSDVTYRIYDWNRPGLDGKPRRLHVEAALKALKFDESRMESGMKVDGKSVEIRQGELILVPAVCEIVDIYPDSLGCELLEAYMPQ